MKGKPLKNKEKSLQKFISSSLFKDNDRFKIIDLTDTHCKFIDTKYDITYEKDRKSLYRGSIPHYSKHLDWKESFYNSNKNSFQSRPRPEEYLDILVINNKTFIKYKDLLTGLIVKQRAELYFNNIISNEIKTSLEEFVRCLDPDLKENKFFLHKDNKYIEYIDSSGIFVKQRIDAFLANRIPKSILKDNFRSSFFDRVKSIHGDKFDYSGSVYINTYSDIEIFCNTCKKYFTQKAGSHLYSKYGCSHCWKESKTSRREREWRDFFSSLGYEIQTNIRPSWFNGLELDIFIPSLNLGIEYNGLAYHSTYDKTGKLPRYLKSDYHLNKYTLCKENNINLIHIFEHEDQKEWERLLLDYLNNSDSYDISFDNTCYEVVYLSKNYTYFGRSSIVKKQ